MWAFVENAEMRELLEGFEAVWRRVSPEPEEKTETPEPECPSQRVPRWFVEISE